MTNKNQTFSYRGKPFLSIRDACDETGLSMLRNCENATLTLRRQRMNELRRRKKRKRKNLTAYVTVNQRSEKGGD